MTALAANTLPGSAVRLARMAGMTRVAFGAAFVIAPKTVARPWAGSASDTPGAQLLTRSMGVRDLLLGVGLLQALNRGDRHTAADWLGYGVAAGVVDAAATLAAFSGLPRSGRIFLLFIVGALGTDAAIAATLRKPPPPDHPTVAGR